MMPDYFQAQTPKTHIDAMRHAAGCLKKLPFVRSASVDDWGRYSNFSLIVDVEIARTGSARRLKEPRSLAQVKGQLRQSVAEYLSQALSAQSVASGSSEQGASSPPLSAQVQVRPARAVFDDFEATYHLDVDFHPYDPASNTFAVRAVAH